MKIYSVARWENNFCNYGIDIIERDDVSRVLFLNTDKKPYGVISVIEYPSNRSNFSSSLLNWENLIRCSNYYGTPPEERDYLNQPGYMSLAVQKHLKPAATLRFNLNDPFIEQIKLELPDDCLIMKYKEEGSTFICRNCSLADLLNIDEVRNAYEQYGIYDIDWGKVTDYCKKPLSFFSDDSITGIAIERGAKGITQYVIVGLLLGYPIESTVAKLRNTYKTENFSYRFKLLIILSTAMNPFMMQAEMNG